MKVYVVTSGEYSDYQIEAVFTIRTVAEEYIDAVGSDYAWKINEFDVDTFDWRGSKNIYKVRVDIRAGVVTVECVMRPRDYYFSNNENKVDTFYFDGSRSVIMYLKCDGKKNVKKIASERWMQIKALQQVAFPYMYKKAIVDYTHFGLPLHEYPVYNFRTKEIVLNKNKQLDSPEEYAKNMEGVTILL